jgi:hypothetical protein
MRRVLVVVSALFLGCGCTSSNLCSFKVRRPPQETGSLNSKALPLKSTGLGADEPAPPAPLQKDNTIEPAVHPRDE